MNTKELNFREGRSKQSCIGQASVDQQPGKVKFNDMTLTEHMVLASINSLTFMMNLKLIQTMGS